MFYTLISNLNIVARWVVDDLKIDFEEKPVVYYLRVDKEQYSIGMSL